ncbi:MAG: SGNH/GDSL hydrolase family protein [Anaerolineae bacterium]|nr:SGNH/GDSL hydrolase family protein [Anaerolineae bacterium]
MKRPSYANLVLAAASVVIVLIVCEGVVRVGGQTDENNQFYFGNQAIKPYALPVTSVTRQINEYVNAPTSYIEYDPDLGWTNRPKGASENGLYRANAAGLRAEREYDPVAQPGILRIAIFGDSFTHGDEVPFEDSWGQQLEVLLNESGIHAEVINFGVGGYGMDQAFLRWQRIGRQYAPDVVLFGFQAENVGRNVNIFRPFYDRRNAIPFFKPRFVLDGRQSLQLTHTPTTPPEQVPEVIANFIDSPLADLEEFFNKEDYTETLWLKSKLIGLVYTYAEPRISRLLKGNPPLNLFDPESEPGQLSLAIIEAFKEDVEAHGADFVVIHLPLPTTLWQLSQDQPIDYPEMLGYLDEHFRVVHTENQFLDGITPIPDYFVGHYSAKGNAAVARSIADYLSDRELSMPKALTGND